MWTMPLVVSILARWLPSSTSSTISGWRPRASPTCGGLVGVGATRSTQTAASGRPTRSGQRRQRRRAFELVELLALERDEPDRPWLAGGAGRAVALDAHAERDVRRLVRGRGRVPGESRPSASGPSRRAVARSASVAPAAPSSIRVRPASTAQRQARRDGHGGDRRRDDEQADHDRRRLARRPVLERADHERVAQRPVAEGLRDELLVGVGRRVDLVVQAVDGGRPYAVRMASPTAIPTIRATVTTAEAVPKRGGRRPPRPPSSAA